MNRFERLIRVDRLLRGRRPVPMRKFTDSLGVSRSTVTRDFEYLRDFLGAPIRYDSESNGHHYDPDAETFDLPGLWLNQSELHALLAVEQLLEATQPGVLAPYLGPLRSRVRSLLGRGGVSAETLGQRVQLVESARRAEDAEWFGTVAEAVLSSRLLKFNYRSRSRDETRERTVHPQRLLHYRSNWYLAGICNDIDELRMFSVDGIREATLLDKAARTVAKDELDRWVGGSFGIFSGTATAWATLRFEPDAARWVSTERWHPDQLGIWRDGAYELQVPYANPIELIMEILRHGSNVEVLAPQSLRDAVASRLREAAARY